MDALRSRDEVVIRSIIAWMPCEGVELVWHVASEDTPLQHPPGSMRWTLHRYSLEIHGDLLCISLYIWRAKIH